MGKFCVLLPPENDVLMKRTVKKRRKICRRIW